MTLRQLGSSSLEITPVGLGTWAIGGPGPFGWGPQDDADSIAAIRRAVERGINWLDTAPVYGLGYSERIVARALDGFSEADRPLVFTKVSFRWDEEGTVSHVLKAVMMTHSTSASLSLSFPRSSSPCILGILRSWMTRSCRKPPGRM